jgi:hypothetical protein
MKQTNNQKSLQLYFSFVMLGGYFAAEPIFLKLFFQTYLPDFYYRSLTVPLSGVLDIAAIQQWRLYRGYYPITGTIILQQLKSKSFTQQCIAGISAIRQAVLSTRQAFIFLGLNFWEGIKFQYQFFGKVLVSILNWKRKLLTTRHQRTNRNSYSKKIATEPMALVWQIISYGCFLFAQLFHLLLLIYIPILFWQNIPRWGWFDTTLICAWEAFLIFLLSFFCGQGLMNVTKLQQLANQSGEDLLELSESLQSLEAEGWQFKYRVILPENKNGFQWKKCNFKSLTSRLSNILKKQRDIDVFATSPDDCNFVIDLKSHVGDVFWNSKSKELRRQYGKNLESKPFEKDIFDQINGQARRLKTFNKLSRKPERILLFWRATVKINKNDRVKRGVLISNKESLIDDLRKRNNDLSK